MNTFGRIFRVSIFGESHGEGIGVVLDGVPEGIELRDPSELNHISYLQPDVHTNLHEVQPSNQAPL